MAPPSSSLKPISSMTGYGRALSKDSGHHVLVEITSVNNRFLKLQFKMADHLQALRQKFEDLVKKHVVRGSLTLNILFETPRALPGITVNKDWARKYVRDLKALSRELGLAMPDDIGFLASVPGLFHAPERLPALSREDTRLLRETLDRALDKLVADRQREGRSLVRDIRRRQKIMVKEVKAIQKKAPAVMEAFSRRLLERMNDLLRGTGVQAEPTDVLREVASYSDRVDITEELIRLNAHLAHIQTILHEGGECGKKIDFVLQEVHREINTLGSKAGSSAISPNVVAIKGEVEKIREQVQNLE